MDDSEIIKRVLEGDRNLFEKLIERYETSVFRWVSRMVPRNAVHEVSQDVFVRAYKDLRGYRAEAPFGHWLSRIARNAAYDYWRRTRRDRLTMLTAGELEMIAARDQLLTSGSAAMDAKHLVEKVFGCLGAEDRLVFSLFYLDQLAVKDISSELGISVSKVKILLFRSRKKIQKYLQD